MGLLNDADRDAIRKEFEKLTGKVRLINFTQEHECSYCRETNGLVSELAGLSDRISLETYDFMSDKNVADEYKIDKIPATIVAGEGDYGIRFYGIPSGYEFATLIEDIKMVSSGEAALSPQTRDFLGKLKKPLHLQVFVTPM